MHSHVVNKQKQRINGGNPLTQFYILIISENENDIGPDVADVPVPLQTRPEAMPRQVARALGLRKDYHQDEEKKKKREKRREPPPCHHASLQSPLQAFDQHSLQLSGSA